MMFAIQRCYLRSCKRTLLPPSLLMLDQSPSLPIDLSTFSLSSSTWKQPLHSPTLDHCNPLKWIALLNRSHHPYSTIMATNCIQYICAFQNERFNNMTLSRTVRGMLHSHDRNKEGGVVGKSKHRSLNTDPINLLCEELKNWLISLSYHTFYDLLDAMKCRIDYIKSIKSDNFYPRIKFYSLLNKLESILTTELYSMKKQAIIDEFYMKCIELESHSQSILSFGILFLMYLYRNTRNTPLFLSPTDIDGLRSATNSVQSSASSSSSSSSFFASSSSSAAAVNPITSSPLHMSLTTIQAQSPNSLDKASVNINIRNITYDSNLPTPSSSSTTSISPLAIASTLVPVYDLTHNNEKLRSVMLTITGQCIQYLLNTPEFIKVFPIAIGTTATVKPEEKKGEGGGGEGEDSMDMYVNPFLNIDGNAIIPASILQASSFSNLSQFNSSSSSSSSSSFNNRETNSTSASAARARALRNANAIKWFDTGILPIFQTDRKLMSSFMSLHGLLFELARLTGLLQLARKAAITDYSQQSEPELNRKDMEHVTTTGGYCYWLPNQPIRYYKYNQSDFLSYKNAQIQFYNLLRIHDGLRNSLLTCIKSLYDAGEQHSIILKTDEYYLTTAKQSSDFSDSSSSSASLWLIHFQCATYFYERLIKELLKSSMNAGQLMEQIKKLKQLNRMISNRQGNKDGGGGGGIKIGLDDEEQSSESDEDGGGGEGKEDEDDEWNLDNIGRDRAGTQAAIKAAEDKKKKDASKKKLGAILGAKVDSDDDLLIEDTTTIKGGGSKVGSATNSGGEEEDGDGDHSNTSVPVTIHDLNCSIASYKFVAKLQQLCQTINYYLPADYRAELTPTSQLIRPGFPSLSTPNSPRLDSASTSSPPNSSLAPSSSFALSRSNPSSSILPLPSSASFEINNNNNNNTRSRPLSSDRPNRVIGPGGLRVDPTAIMKKR